MGIFSIGSLELSQTPVEKAQAALNAVVQKEIKKRRNSTLRDNVINSQIFIGISKENELIDPEDETISVRENTYTAQVEYVPFDKESGVELAPIVMLDESWVEHMNHPQLVEFMEELFMSPLDKPKEGEKRVVNEDWSDYENLQYKISESTASEIEAKEKGILEEDGSCDIDTEGDSSAEMDSDEDGELKDDGSKTTSDTLASFTKMKGKMTGDIKDFVSSSSKKQSEEDILRIQSVQDILEDGMRFSGIGKAKTISPSKRLNMRAIITESSEKEYIGKKQGSGKKVKIMVTIDRSGSMSGQPTTESNVLISALNNIVLENKELEVEVMLSYTGAFTKFKLPIGKQFSQEIWDLRRTGDAEYLWQNMKENMDSLINADINLVYTDGSICDDPIDKIFLERRDVHITGLYVSSAMKIDDLKAHYNRNKMYFHHVVVRPSIQELAEEVSSKIFTEKTTR